jgi:hypothetical protein
MFARRELPDRLDAGACTVLPVDPPPDLPLRSVRPDDVRRWIGAALEDLERRSDRLGPISRSPGGPRRPVGG